MNKLTETQKIELKKYFDAWREVRKDNRLMRADLALMDSMQDQAFKDVYFSYNTWGEKIGASRSTVIRSFIRLEKMGYVKTYKSNRITDTVHIVLDKKLQHPLSGEEADMQKLQARIASVTGDMIQSDVESQVILPSVTGDTTLVSRVTYKRETGNDKNERESLSLATLANPDVLLDQGSGIKEPAMSTKSVHDNSDMVSSSGKWQPLSALQRWEIAKEHGVQPINVFIKEREVIKLFKEGGKTYGKRSVEDLTSYFVACDVKKGFIQQFTDPLYIQAFIDNEHPDKVAEREATIEKMKWVFPNLYKQNESLSKVTIP